MYEVCINNDFGKHKKSRLKNFLVHNKLLVFFSMCLLLGVFCGSLLMTFADATEQSIGVVINGKFYFYSLSCGYSRVKLAINKAAGRDSWDCGKKTDDMSASGLELVELLKRRSQSMLPLNDILLRAGFWPAETDEEVALDLTKIDRSTLIELFS